MSSLTNKILAVQRMHETPGLFLLAVKQSVFASKVVFVVCNVRKIKCARVKLYACIKQNTLGKVICNFIWIILNYPLEFSS